MKVGVRRVLSISFTLSGLCLACIVEPGSWRRFRTPIGRLCAGAPRTADYAVPLSLGHQTFSW